MNSLENRRILVTGAGSGIGRATAIRLSQHRARVILAGRNPERLSESAGHCDGSVETLRYDVTDEVAVKTSFKSLQGEGLHGLVYCAGVMMDAGLVMTRLEGLDQLYRVNLRACYHHIQLAARLMSREDAASIVTLASVVGEHGSEGQTAYSAVKAGVSGLTKSAAKELGKLGIRVNAVAPGFVDTPMTGHYNLSKRREIAEKTVLGRLGTADEIAETIIFLLSSGAGYITGQVLEVDGGFQP